MAFANHGRAGARFHPNGVKSTPWETQKISRIGQHVQGARRPRPEHEEVKCLKIGERAQTLTVEQPPRRQEAHGWDVQANPWSRSSQEVGSYHQSDSLGRVDLRSERQRKELRNASDTLRWDRPRSHRVGDPHGAGPPVPPPPPIAPPDPVDAARREVRRRAERDHRRGITSPPQREPGPRTEKGLRAEALARMRQRHGPDGGGAGAGGGDSGGGGGGGVFGAEGKEFFKPGDWYTPSAPSQKQKLEGAVAELCRRTPGLTQMAALEKIGAQMDAALNRPNAAAAQHFKMAHHGPANAARV